MIVCNACGIETVRYAEIHTSKYCLNCSVFFSKEDVKMDDVIIDYDNNNIKYDNEETVDEDDYSFEDLTEEELEDI